MVLTIPRNSVPYRPKHPSRPKHLHLPVPRPSSPSSATTPRAVPSKAKKEVSSMSESANQGKTSMLFKRLFKTSNLEQFMKKKRRGNAAACLQRKNHIALPRTRLGAGAHHQTSEHRAFLWSSALQRYAQPLPRYCAAVGLWLCRQCGNGAGTATLRRYEPALSTHQTRCRHPLLLTSWHDYCGNPKHFTRNGITLDWQRRKQMNGLLAAKVNDHSTNVALNNLPAFCTTNQLCPTRNKITPNWKR